MTEKGVEFETVNYLEKPLAARELKELLGRAGLKPEEAMRKGEAAYREHVAGKNLSDAELIALMAKHPELLQRPLVVREGKAVMARPVGNLEKLGIG